MLCFFFKQKTAYEMRISDWSSDVCSSDLTIAANARLKAPGPGWSPGGAIWATAASPSCGGSTDERRSPPQGPRCSRSPAQAAAATAGPGRTGVLGPLSGWAPPFPEVPELWFVAASAALHVRALRFAGLRLGAEQRQGHSVFVDRGPSRDRKSVGSGKSVSGRVVLGGRRNIKKKNK